MIGPKLFIATIILASGILTACSDASGPSDTRADRFAGGALFAEGSRQCPAPGTDLAGALNMIHDATMLAIPMARDAEQGNIGMARAVAQSAC
jgi:hypothetical protein